MKTPQFLLPATLALFLATASLAAPPNAPTVKTAPKPTPYETTLATFLPGLDSPCAVLLDQNSNILIVGTTASDNFASTLDPAPKPAGKKDFAVLKLSPDASKILAATRWGGDADDIATHAALDADGNLLIAGTTTSSSTPDTLALTKAKSAGQGDLTLLKLSPDFTPLSAVRFPTSAFTYAAGLALDRKGNIFVAGTKSSPDFPTTPDAIEPKFSGRSAGFLLVLDKKLSKVLYGTSLNSSSTFVADASATALTVTPDGMAIIAGLGMPPMATTPNAIFKGTDRTASFLAVINPYKPGKAGLLDLTFLPIHRIHPHALLVDSAKNLLLAGEVWPGTGPDAFIPVAPIQEKFDSSVSALFVKLNPPISKIELATALGGSGQDVATTLLLDSQKSTFVIGWTTNSEFPTVSPLQPQNAGAVPNVPGGDLFITRISPDNKIQFSTYFGGPASEIATAATLTPDNSLLIVGTSSGPGLPTTKNALAEKSPSKSLSAFLLKISPITPPPAPTEPRP